MRRQVERDYFYILIVTDLIIVVVILLERDINRLVVEAQEVLEPVKLWDEG